MRNLALVDVMRCILLWCCILHSYSSAETKYRLVTKPFYLNDEIYFELLEPSEISYTYKIRPARDFGSDLNVTKRLRLVPVKPLHACGPFTVESKHQVLNQVAFMVRGQCSFLTKAINAEAAGAAAAIIYDSDHANDNRMIDMIWDETPRSTAIASYFLLGKDGYMIRRKLDELGLSGAVINIPLNGTRSIKVSKQPPWTYW